MIQAFSQGQDIRDYLVVIRDCYEQHHEMIPPLVSLAMAFSTNMKSTKPSSNSNSNTNDSKDDSRTMLVDKGTLDTIRDFLASQCFDEEECTSCPEK